MSQSHNPRDNQALLQSMLQRLKLQAGTTNVQSGQYATVGQNAQSETSDVQTVNNNAINGFEPTDNLKREFAVNGEIQVFGRSSEDSKTLGQRKEHGQDSLSQSGQLSPKPVKDAATIFSEGNDSFINCETKKNISSALNTGGSTEQTQDQNNSFVPKVYAWSLNSTGTHSGGQEPLVGGGVFGATGQTTQTVSSSQNTTNIRKQRSSEKKTQRWTQKIKAKWRERPGSFGKKDREYRQGAEETTHENPPQYQPVKEEIGGTPASIDSTDPTKSHTQAADGNEEYMRTTTDFDLGLGSFSLLDEIVSGQEWAKFLNPTIPVSVPERQDHKTSQDHQLINHLNSNSGINLMSQEAGKSRCIFGMSREAPTTDIAMTQTSPEASLPGMDITEKNQIQSEPMDHGQSQSDMQITVSEPQLQLQPAAKLANKVDNSSLKGRSNLSRKRQYQLTERIETTFQRDISNGNETADDSVFLPDNHAVNRIDGSHGKIMPSSSSSPSPCSPVPRGVLKLSVFRNSESSMETVIKKRRVEENRRVRFSEEIIAINPPELGPDMIDSENSEEEESFIEEDSEEQADPSMLGPVRQEEVVPARRHALPGWIRALKRKNTGKKPR